MISLALNPYVYCAANPIRFIDPTGCILFITGDDVDGAMNLLTQAVQGINLSISKDGIVSYTLDKNSKLNKNAKKLIKAIDDQKVNVKITSQKSSELPGNQGLLGGAFMGNQYDSNTQCVNTSQYVRPSALEKMDESTGKKGQHIMHEITESYEGGLLALKAKEGDSNIGENNKFYAKAHSKATSQVPLVYPNFTRLADWCDLSSWTPTNRCQAVRRPCTRIDWYADNGRKKVIFESEIRFCTVEEAKKFYNIK